MPSGRSAGTWPPLICHTVPGGPVWVDDKGWGRKPEPRRPPSPAPCPQPGRKLLPTRPRPPPRRPGTWQTRGGRGSGRRPSGGGGRRGRGAGAQMGATEKSGKKSRRLFSSLRPWKATRRLWRTRSASKAAQGECGRGRGTCYCAPRVPAFYCWGAAVAPKAVGGISRWVLGPQLTPLPELPRTHGRGRRRLDVWPCLGDPAP